MTRPHRNSAAAFALLPGDTVPTGASLPAIDPTHDNAVDLLLERGIAADRVACPDLRGQLTAMRGKSVNRVIVNLIPATPIMRPDLTVAWCAEAGELMLTGLRFLRKLTGARPTLATDGPAAGALPPITRRVGRVVTLRRSYPQGDPHVLIYTLTGRKLPVGQLPTARRVLLLDGPAVTAIADAAEGRPLTHVPAQIDGDLRRVRVGTTLAELSDDPMLAGDALRKRAVGGDYRIGHGELIFRTVPPKPDAPDACIRCGWCLDACPTHIHPAGIGEAAQLGDRAMADRYGLDHCIDCGNCEAVCPSRLPLLDAIRSLR